MNLRYSEDLLRDTTIRSQFRLALLDICFIFTEGSPIDRLQDDSLKYNERGPKDVPARLVLPDVDRILSIDTETVRENRDILLKFREYVLNQIEREKAQTIAAKFAKQVVKAQMLYSEAQNMIINELGNVADKMSAEGW